MKKFSILLVFCAGLLVGQITPKRVKSSPVVECDPVEVRTITIDQPTPLGRQVHHLVVERIDTPDAILWEKTHLFDDPSGPTWLITINNTRYVANSR